MANEEHLKILKQGVEAWNEWREKNPQITPDLSKADLYEADLYEADLNGAQDLTAEDSSGFVNKMSLAIKTSFLNYL